MIHVGETELKPDDYTKMLTVIETNSTAIVDDELASLSHIKCPAMEEPVTAHQVESISSSGSPPKMKKVQKPRVKARITTPKNMMVENRVREVEEEHRVTRSPECVMK